MLSEPGSEEQTIETADLERADWTRAISDIKSWLQDMYWQDVLVTCPYILWLTLPEKDLGKIQTLGSVVEHLRREALSAVDQLYRRRGNLRYEGSELRAVWNFVHAVRRARSVQISYQHKSRRR